MLKRPSASPMNREFAEVIQKVLMFYKKGLDVLRKRS